MKLKSVKFSNYKNLLDEYSVSFGPLNIFIGPNGSGKTNVTSMLQFIKRSFSSDIPGSDGSGFIEAVELLGRDHIARVGSASKTVGFDCVFGDYYNTNEMIFSLSFVREKQGPAYIVKESLQEDSGKPRPFVHYERRLPASTGVVSVPREGGRTDLEDVEGLRLDTLALNDLLRVIEKSSIPPEDVPVYKRRRELMDCVGSWQFFSSNNMNLRLIRESEPKIGQLDTRLSDSCENLAAVIENLVNEDISFEEVLNWEMARCLPSSKRIRAVRSGRLRVSIEWHFDQLQEPLYLNDMSDGTVRMLCLAVFLFSSQNSLLVLDEPELGLHVAWMPILADWIRRASESNTVMVSTHSPDLLDYFTDNVESVYVFSPKGDKGFAPVKLNREKLQKPFEEDWQLGDLYRVGDPTVGGWPW